MSEAACATTCRRIATYERVSSEDQRNRETILMQTEALAQRLEAEPEVELVERFQDDGISGTVPFGKRPGGARLLAAAEQGLMDEVWVYRIDRLGRDDVDPMLVWRELDDRGIAVHSLHEGHLSPFIFHIHVAVAAEERRAFLKRSADGMARAAAEGRFCGGIVPMGYRVTAETNTVVPDEAEVLAADMTPAEVVRHMYRRLALDHVTCWAVAAELNLLGVPTAYRKDGRGIRGKRTRGIWMAGRVRNMVINPVPSIAASSSTGDGARSSATSSPPASRAWSQTRCGTRPKRCSAPTAGCPRTPPAPTSCGA